MSASSASSVLAGLGDIRDAQEELYRSGHANPELSHREHGTASVAAERLREAGFEVHAGIGGVDTGTQALVVAAPAWLAD